MTGQSSMILGGGIALVAIIWWPAPTGSRSMLLGGIAAVSLSQRRVVRAGPVAAAMAIVLGFAAGLALVGMVTGLAAAVLTSVCVGAVVVQVRSRRSMREADELAQLTSTLANQALVAPTVVEAVRQAAPLIPGRVGTAIRQLAAECETGGLVEAANRFAGTIGRPIAEMVADVVAEAFRGGSQWVGLAEVLADEAAEAADTARHFHRYVAALMPQVAVTVVMAVGMVAITGFAARDVGRWLTSSVGQQFLLLLAVITAALCARVLAPAWRIGR